MNCTRCDAPLPEGARFCNQCGARVAEEAAPRACASCGAELLAGATFCNACGARVGVSIPSGLWPSAAARGGGSGAAASPYRGAPAGPALDVHTGRARSRGLLGLPPAGIVAMAMLAGGAAAVALLRSSPTGIGMVVGPTLEPTTNLERLALHLEDLPSAFVFGGQQQLDNRAAAKLLDEPDKWLRDYESWGRVDGLLRHFRKDKTPAVEFDLVYASVETYRTNEGAAQAAGAELAEFRQKAAAQIREFGLNLSALEERRAPSVGDQGTMWHVRASGTWVGAPMRIDALAVNFRRANVLLEVAWWSFNTGSVLEDDVLQLARKQDELIQAALRGELRPALGPMPTSVAPSLAAPSPTPARQRAVPRTPTVRTGPLPFLGISPVPRTPTVAAGTTAGSRPCGEEASLRSTAGTTQSTIALRNERSTDVRIYWLNYGAQRESYGVVSPQQEVTQQTYLTHPWVITDASGRCLGIYLPPGTATIR